MTFAVIQMYRFGDAATYASHSHMSQQTLLLDYISDIGYTSDSVIASGSSNCNESSKPEEVLL